MQKRNLSLFSTPVVRLAIISLSLLLMLMFNITDRALGDALIATVPVSGPPFWATYVPDNGKIYVTQTNSGHISVIDGTTNSVVNTITMSYPFVSAFSPVDHMLYVTNYWDGTVTKVEPSSDTIVGTIPLGQVRGTCVCPSFIAVNSVNGLLYVGGMNYVGTVPQDSVFVVNPSAGSVVTTINVNFPVGGLAYNQDNNMLYASLPQNTPLDSVAVIDTSTNLVVTNIAVDPAPFGITVNPANGMTYVASEHAKVTPITSANTVASTITPPSVGPDILSPHGITYNQGNGKVYVAGLTPGSAYVFSIDSATNTVSTDPPIQVGLVPHEIAYDSANGNLYVPNWGSNTVSVISTTPSQQTVSSVCPSENVKHWDKIVFSIKSPEIAKRLNLSANTQLDIKVLDDPTKVADLKQKVLNFLHAGNVNRSNIEILDVGYAIICSDK